MMRALAAATLWLLCWTPPSSAAAGKNTTSSKNKGWPLPIFFRDLKEREPSTLATTLPDHLYWLAGYSHYRLIPGRFPDGMGYHFDGLAMVMKLKFNTDHTVEYAVRGYESALFKDYDSCNYIGSGVGPTAKGPTFTFENPAVNLLPIDNQLWLTTDTRFWGRVDMDTLETYPNDKAVTLSMVLNAHPACDPSGSPCYVFQGCKDGLVTNQACVAELVTHDVGGMGVLEVANATLPTVEAIMHSHSPAITQSLFIAKVEHFMERGVKDQAPYQGGILKTKIQGEDNLWVVMDRHSKATRVLTADTSFVNNHFWCAYDTPQGTVVDTVSVTEHYLDQYYRETLANKTNWDRLFYPPKRCLVPPATSVKQEVRCKDLLKDKDVIFDYPTFNPHVKGHKYQYFYAIAPRDKSKSQWFDSIIKVDAQAGKVVAEWHNPGVYVTEADFVPREDAGVKEEDNGVLLSVIYDSKADASSLLVLDARRLRQLAVVPLAGDVVAFHAHGVVCTPVKCYTNP